MKPNLIVYHPPRSASDSLIERICEQLCESHYVYLIRPGSEFRDDSPAGVRFLNHTLDRLPGFAEVATAIAIGGGEISARLMEAYPKSGHASWDPENDGGFPVETLPGLRPAIFQGSFRKSVDNEFDKAM